MLLFNLFLVIFCNYYKQKKEGTSSWLSKTVTDSAKGPYFDLYSSYKK